MRKIPVSLVVAILVWSLPALAQGPDQSLNVHNLKFFLDPALVEGMDADQLTSNITQYAEDLNFIFAKQTNRRFAFDPSSGVTLANTPPHTGYAGTLPEEGYELWVHASLTDKPTYGTYGGHASFDISGAGVAAGLKWDAVHNPSVLADGSEDLRQYWRQIDHVVHEFEHVFGAGLGEYYGLARVDDTRGVEPVVNIRKTATDPFWSRRQDYFADPLLNNIYGLDLVGSPTTLAELRDTVRFADVTVNVVNLGPRQLASRLATLPDLSAVKVEILDDHTGLPISDAGVEVWNVRSASPYVSEEVLVTPSDSLGEFEFSWGPYPHISVFSNYSHLKLIEAHAEGYEAEALWVSIYDAMQEKLGYGHDEMVLTLRLVPDPLAADLPALSMVGGFEPPPVGVPEPSTLLMLSLAGAGVLRRRRRPKRRT